MKYQLEKYLRSALPHKDELCIQKLHRINQGNSNMMVGFTLQWREGISILSRNYILRMPSKQISMEPYLPGREYRLLRALKTTPIPVPGMLLLEENESIFGKPFLIMEKIDGNTLLLSYHTLPPEKKKRLSWEYAETLAEIHSTDWRGLGLFTEDAPGDVERFARRELKKCSDKLEEIEGIPRRILENAMERLRDKAPREGEPALIHGDYNMANLLHMGEKITAVLDWETACIGDPALDLGWLYPGNALALGLPMHREDFIRLYRSAGGREPENLRFYQELAMVKLTITCIQACISLNRDGREQPSLPRMGFTIPYILNSLCYLVTVGLKALQPGRFDARRGTGA